jgi:hypothetical protein
MGQDEPNSKKRKIDSSVSGASSSSADSGATLQTWNETAWMNQKASAPALNQLRIFHLALESPINGTQTSKKAKKYSNLKFPKDKEEHQKLLQQYLDKVVYVYKPDVIVLGEYHRTETTWQLNGVNYYVYPGQGAKKSTSNTYEFTSDPTSDMTLLVREDAPVSRYMVNFRPWHRKGDNIRGGGQSGKWLEDQGIVNNKKARRVFSTCISILSSGDKTDGDIFNDYFNYYYINPLKTYCEKLKALNQSTFADLISITYRNRNILFVHLPNERTANAGMFALEEYLKGINDNFFNGTDPFYDLIIGDLNLGGHSNASERTYAAAIYGTTLIFNTTTQKFGHIGFTRDPAVSNRIGEPVMMDLGLPVWTESGQKYLLGDHEGVLLDVTSTTSSRGKSFEELLTKKFQWFPNNAKNLSNLISSGKKSASSSAKDTMSIATSSATHLHLPRVSGVSLQNQKFKNFEDRLARQLKSPIADNDTFFSLVGYLDKYTEDDINIVLKVINSDQFKQYFKSE